MSKNNVVASPTFKPIPPGDFTMRAVESSLISEIGYNSDLCMMQVRFKSGPLYQFSNVSPDLWEELIFAESVGSAYSRLVKKNSQIPFVRIAEQEESQ